MNTFRKGSLLAVLVLLSSLMMPHLARAADQPIPADWQTYTDYDYGFQFAYPPAWQVEVLYTDLYASPETNNKRIALRDETATLAYVTVWTLAEDQTMSEWLVLHKARFYSSQAELPAAPNASFAGQPAWFILSAPEEQVPGIAAVIFQRGDLVFAIEYIARDRGAAQETVADVFGSFAFTNEFHSYATLPAADLPVLPWFEPDIVPLLADCCGYHDGQSNPYLCNGGNCVWWAAYKRDDITTESLGNAMNWITNAPSYGFPVGKVPVVGAVVVYQPGVQWAGSVGHVAYVETVIDATHFTISEMSWGGDCTVHTRTSWVEDGVDFIYHKNTVIRPSYVAASDGQFTNQVLVEWNASAGATRYQVWRGTTSSSAQATKLADNVLTTSYSDTTAAPGILYYYWVIACNDQICTGFSSYNTGFAALVSPPDPPPAPAASDGTYPDSVTVSWSSVSDADRYEVWRASSPDPAAASLLETDASNPYSDASAFAGALYYYWLKACSASGCSGFSSFDSGYAAGLGTPSGVAATDGEFADYVEVSFTAVTGASEYEVYRNTTSDVSGATLLGATAASPYQDATAETGAVYYYWVRARDVSTYGSFSDPDTGSRTPVSPPGLFAKTSPAIGASDQLSNLTLSWAASSGAVSYEYCLDTLDDDACNGTWISAGASTSAALTNLAPELTYFWQVRAVNADGITYADGSAAWWNFTTHAECYRLHLGHTGSGTNPVASPDRSPVCAEAGTYVAGASVSLSGAAADPAWRILNWSGTNNNSSTSATNTLTMPAGHHTALVNYAINCFALTITTSGPGTVPVASPPASAGCSAGSYVPGELITLSGADADTGYYISGWSGTNDNASTYTSNTVSMPWNSHTASVIYSPECYSLNFQYDPAGSGTVDLDYTDRCDSGAFPYGAQVTITAEPASSIYRFLNWSGDATGTANPVQVSVTHDTIITVHFEQSTFADVPWNHWAYASIDSLYASNITMGCGNSPLVYCPEDQVTRAQMAIFLERGMKGSDYTPPAATGALFSDVPDIFWAAQWIEQLFLDGITSGCGAGNYCPGDFVTRAQMAVFLLRAEHGSAYQPPSPAGVFLDVPSAHWAAGWIEQLAAEGITMGCGQDIFCPDDSVTRAQMAVFMVRTFNLP